MHSIPVDLLYHVLPLHYGPFLLKTGAVFSQAELRRRALPIQPRSSAARRDRKLKLDRFVHLSPRPITPLLRDKLQKGYPHLIVTFTPNILSLSGAGLVRYNAKAWRHREDFLPVTNAEELAAVWSGWKGGRYPSLEIVVPEQLPLFPCGRSLIFADEWQQEWCMGLCHGMDIPCPLEIDSWRPEWPTGAEYDRAPFTAYREECLRQQALLPPPGLPFD